MLNGFCWAHCHSRRSLCAVLVLSIYLPGEGCNNDLYFRGLKFDIIVNGKKVELKSNGEAQRTQNAKTESSPLGIRVELGPIQIKNLRYKPLS